MSWFEKCSVNWQLLNRQNLVEWEKFTLQGKVFQAEGRVLWRDRLVSVADSLWAETREWISSAVVRSLLTTLWWWGLIPAAPRMLVQCPALTFSDIFLSPFYCQFYSFQSNFRPQLDSLGALHAIGGVNCIILTTGKGRRSPSPRDQVLRQWMWWETGDVVSPRFCLEKGSLQTQVVLRQCWALWTWKASDYKQPHQCRCREYGLCKEWKLALVSLCEPHFPCPELQIQQHLPHRLTIIYKAFHSHALCMRGFQSASTITNFIVYHPKTLFFYKHNIIQNPTASICKEI